jgi:hypothetical protein
VSRKIYTVTPASPGAPRPWVLRRDGYVLGYHDTQKGAHDNARLLATNRLKLLGKLAEVQVHGKDGQIKRKDTYGDDPPETKG